MKTFLMMAAMILVSATTQAADVTVSLAERYNPATQDSGTVARVVEGRLWQTAIADCVRQGKIYAVRAPLDEGTLVIQVIPMPSETQLSIGGFGRFDCRN